MRSLYVMSNLDFSYCSPPRPLRQLKCIGCISSHKMRLKRSLDRMIEDSLKGAVS